jgi:hypothetical protein
MVPTSLYTYTSIYKTLDAKLGKHSRPYIIARIPSLLTLDGATVSDTIEHSSIRMKRVLDFSQRTYRFRAFLHVNYHAARSDIR